jgi:hypothetical protein
LQSHHAILITWAIILLLVYASKLSFFGAYWEFVPKQYRPLVVAGLGVLAAVGQAVLGGTGWVDALVTNLFAALATIGADQVQSKLRDGE